MRLDRLSERGDPCSRDSVRKQERVGSSKELGVDTNQEPATLSDGLGYQGPRLWGMQERVRKTPRGITYKLCDLSDIRWAIVLSNRCATVPCQFLPPIALKRMVNSQIQVSDVGHSWFQWENV